MSAVLFRGSKVVVLKDRLQLSTGVTLISSTVDPTVTAVDASPGDLILSTLTKKLYQKQDSGSSTNWTTQAAVSGTAPNQALPYYDASGNLKTEVASLSFDDVANLLSATNIAVSGNATLGAVTGNSLSVTGNTSLAAASASSLNVSGASVLSGTTVNGALSVTGNSTLAAATASSLITTGNLTVQGNESISGTLGLAGSANLASDLVVAGNTTLNGNLTVSGTLTYLNTTDLEVTDKTIVINKGGAANTGASAGIYVEENGSNTAHARVSGDRNTWRLKAPNQAGEVILDGGAGGITLNQSSHDPATLTSVGSSPNANAATLSGQQLQLQPADASNPGLVTAGTQTLGGNKTLNGALTVTGNLSVSGDINSAGTFNASALGTAGNLSVGGNAAITGTLSVTGASTLAALTAGSTVVGAATANSLSVTGDTSLAAVSATNGTLTGTLQVVGISSLGTVQAGAISASGNATLAAASANSLSVSGNTILAAASANSLSVTGNSVLAAASASSLVLSGNASVSGELRLADGDASNHVAIKAPATVASNFALTLPDALPAGTRGIQSDTSGNLSYFVIPTGNAGDINETSFSVPASTANLDVFAMAVGTRSLNVTYSLANTASDLYETGTLLIVRKNGSFDIARVAAGDDTGITFAMDASGNLEVTSGAASATLKYRALATSV